MKEKAFVIKSSINSGEFTDLVSYYKGTIYHPQSETTIMNIIVLSNWTQYQEIPIQSTNSC